MFSHLCFFCFKSIIYHIYLSILELFNKISQQLSSIVLNPSDHHQCYQSIGVTLARNPFIKSALTDIHNMTHSMLEPLFLDEADITTSPHELLTQDFLLELGITPQDEELPNPNHLKTSVTNAMKAAQFPEESIQPMIQHLFDDTTKEFLFIAKKANDNARRFGFSSFSCLRELATEECFDPKLRLYDISFTTSDLAKIIENSPLLLTDDPAQFFRNLLAKFCQSPRPANALPPHPRVSEIQAKARRNAARLLTRQVKTISLNEFAKQGLPLHRLIPRKAVSLVLRTANKQELSLEQLAVYSCFLCPSMAPVSDNTIHHESLTKSPFLPHVNLKRLVAYDGAKQMLSHIFSEHLGLLGDDHPFCIPCKTCIQKHIANPTSTPLESAFVCCSKCALDHSLLLHTQECRLLAMFSSLEADFRCNNHAKRILEQYLFCRCIACGSLFPSQQHLTAHEQPCFASFTSLSSGFARPLTTDIFFTNSFIQKKETEEAHAHAQEQLTKIVKALESKGPSELAQHARSSIPPPPQPSPIETVPNIPTSKNGKHGKHGISKSSKKTPPSAPFQASDFALPPHRSPTDNNAVYENDALSFNVPFNDAVYGNDALSFNARPLSRSKKDRNSEDDRIWLEAEQCRQTALIPFLDPVTEPDIGFDETVYSPPPKKKLMK